MDNNDVFSKPVVIVANNFVKKYYTSVMATIQDGYDPYKVALVCVHGQKMHKGRVFRFASDLDINAYEIMKSLFERRCKMCNT